MQEPVFQHSCLQPLVDHPSDNTIRHSLVENRPQLPVWNRVEVLAYVDIQHPVLSLLGDGTIQNSQGLMGRMPGPEAMRAGQKLLLVDRLQHHDDRPLRQDRKSTRLNSSHLGISYA